jgi:hypothetical protein
MTRLWRLTESPWTLDGEGVRVHGDILLSDGFKAVGQINLYGAQIDGGLFCGGGEFSNPSGEATLRLRQANIAGEVDLNNGFMSDGIVDAVNSKVGGDLELDSAIFQSANETGLKANGLTAHALYWTNIQKYDTTELDLSLARVTIFGDDEASWPKRGFLTVNGFQYDALDQTGDTGENAGNARLAWLRLQKPLEPQPYKQLARIFLENGQDADAITVLAAKEADMREQAEEQSKQTS